MSVTRQTLMDLAREIADAVASPKWSDATVRTWLGLVHWQEFKNILNANNEYTLAFMTPTENSSGQFLLTDLDTGTGDDTLTHYRIHSIAQNAAGGALGVGPYFYYKEVQYRDYPVPQSNTMMPYVWYLFGSYIQVLPVQPSTTLTVAVNQLPQRADLLASDDSTVVFPAGYETLLAYMTAVHMLVKGGEETPAAQLMKLQADEIRQMMLMDLRRPSIGPTIARALDMSAEWGGV